MSLKQKISRVFEILNTREYVTTSDLEDIFMVNFLEAKRWMRHFEKMGYVRKDAFHPRLGAIFVKGPKLAQRNFNSISSLNDVEVIDMSTC